MVKARKYIVEKIFRGLPKRDDFSIIEYELPELKNGEILVKTEWVSVDAYQRFYNDRYNIPYDQFSLQLGVIEDSKNSKFPIGTRVVSHKGWCDYCVIDPNAPTDNIPPNVRPMERVYEMPDLKGLPNSLSIGAVGMHGATAYFGFLEICKPKAGETAVVTGAAGAVGSLVGQIAKIKGCKVIGFAGSDDKVAWLEKELGFDKAFNYKTVEADAALREAAPNGVDCYFDNVGGELSSVIINHMNLFGRVTVCGSMSTDSDGVLPKATIVQPAIVSKQLKIEGFVVGIWVDRWPEAFEDLVEWISNGQIKTPEHITEGFDKLYDAFVGMLTGKNTGKAVVKI